MRVNTNCNKSCNSHSHVFDCLNIQSFSTTYQNHTTPKFFSFPLEYIFFLCIIKQFRKKSLQIKGTIKQPYKYKEEIQQLQKSKSFSRSDLT